jgi:hypothetical protein
METAVKKGIYSHYPILQLLLIDPILLKMNS